MTDEQKAMICVCGHMDTEHADEHGVCYSEECRCTQWESTIERQKV